jgi:hypothetical protein
MALPLSLPLSLSSPLALPVLKPHDHFADRIVGQTYFVSKTWNSSFENILLLNNKFGHNP